MTCGRLREHGTLYYGQFVELNLFVYNTAKGLLYDAVIWCLGPVIHDSREYGWFRNCLAFATCTVCRRVIGKRR